jgi:hypothetical protein
VTGVFSPNTLEKILPNTHTNTPAKQDLNGPAQHRTHAGGAGIRPANGRSIGFAPSSSFNPQNPQPEIQNLHSANETSPAPSPPPPPPPVRVCVCPPPPLLPKPPVPSPSRAARRPDPLPSPLPSAGRSSRTPSAFQLILLVPNKQDIRPPN